MGRKNNKRAVFVEAYKRLGGNADAVARELGISKTSVVQNASRLRKFDVTGLMASDLPVNRRLHDNYRSVGLFLTTDMVERLDRERGNNKSRSALIEELLTTALAGDLRARSSPAPTGHALRVIVRRAKAEGKVWTEAELRQRGLPLYLSRNWLLRQLSNGETYSSLAREHGWNHRTLAGYAKREYGLEQHHRRINDHLTRVAKWPATVSELATALYDGDNSKAAQWASEAVKDGRLVRVRRGLYDVLDPNPQP